MWHGRVLYKATFVSDVDEHLPFLTVRETCQFALVSTSHHNPGRFESLLLLPFKGKKKTGGEKSEPFDPTDLVLHMMGLQSVANTLVGGQAHLLGSSVEDSFSTVPGISKSHRRRLTAMEMICGAYFVMCFDEFDNHILDKTTINIVSGLHAVASLFSITMAFTLRHPPLEIFQHFDGVLLLDSTQLVYQCFHHADILPYFKQLGYTKAPFVEMYEFLNEVTTDLGANYMDDSDTPKSLAAFVEAYQNSGQHESMIQSSKSHTDAQVWVNLTTPVELDVALDRDGKPIIASILMDGEIFKDSLVAHMIHVGDVLREVRALDDGDDTTAVPVTKHNLEHVKQFLGIHMSLARKKKKVVKSVAASFGKEGNEEGTPDSPTSGMSARSLESEAFGPENCGL
ncbi:hypothetical protein CYMTET_14962 [Cymbomonas tetramitiformis]|uniref:Uncharacterized protein n=1 Tax=Cymbomonas tetramitiformis TaxID=36881 RepID=A0AAE0L9H8_9CHLO|nr:hypothetical protein CYMTET_14962 [Cymbomonas tetramitiformis]